MFHKCHLLRSEMIHFVTNLHSYIMFEVLETSWHKLVKDLKAATDLDELIKGHEDYISAIKENVRALQSLFSPLVDWRASAHMIKHTRAKRRRSCFPTRKTCSSNSSSFFTPSSSFAKCTRTCTRLRCAKCTRKRCGSRPSSSARVRCGCLSPSCVSFFRHKDSHELCCYL